MSLYLFMFTGIIEHLGIIQEIKKSVTNIHLTIKNELTSTLKIDQSVSHNGICLTIVEINDLYYTVTAIEETINKTTISTWKKNDTINIELGTKLNSRLDGHIVQGHIDQTATCIQKKKLNGSTIFTFEHEEKNNLTIEKGSITVNGVSLTAIDTHIRGFSVAIIPYTIEHTNFKNLEAGDLVNLEFDIIGKYVLSYLQKMKYQQ